LRLGFIRRKYDQSGGAELSLRLLVESFAANGHGINVLTQSWEGFLPDKAVIHKIASVSGRARALRTFARAAYEKMRQLDLDLCLSLERVPGVPFFRAGDGCHLAWLRRRAPYEGWLKRHSFYLNPLHRAQLDLEAETLTSPALKLVIANSRMVAEEIKQIYGLGEDQVKVIYNPAVKIPITDKDRREARSAIFKELALPYDWPVLLFLGSGFERKGLAFMIRALSLLPQVSLLVAGRGRTAFYERLASKCGVSERAKFLGLRSDADRLLAASDVSVLPTIYDPCANVCLEALAAGKPVVTTSANGASEMISQGENGFIIEDPADINCLADACRQALALSGPVNAPLQTVEQWFRELNAALGLQ
jgi:UDP-glucose:(heptosyl)LPS alpha-1,3-glucosyltransferase